MNSSEHKNEAEKLLADAVEIEQNEAGALLADRLIARAQVHALLAQLPDERPSSTPAGQAWGPEFGSS